MSHWNKFHSVRICIPLSIGVFGLAYADFQFLQTGRTFLWFENRIFWKIYPVSSIIFLCIFKKRIFHNTNAIYGRNFDKSFFFFVNLRRIKLRKAKVKPFQQILIIYNLHFKDKKHLYLFGKTCLKNLFLVQIRS